MRLRLLYDVNSATTDVQSTCGQNCWIYFWLLLHYRRSRREEVLPKYQGNVGKNIT